MDILLLNFSSFTLQIQYSMYGTHPSYKISKNVRPVAANVKSELYFYNNMFREPSNLNYLY